MGHDTSMLHARSRCQHTICGASVSAKGAQ